MVMALDEAADVDVALVEQLPPPAEEEAEEDEEDEEEDEGWIVVAVGMVINPCLNAEQFLAKPTRK
jgi:hypothetical protein